MKLNMGIRMGLLALLCCWVRPLAADESDLSLRAEARFEEVVSILEARCFGCHGPEKKKGKVNFTLYPDLKAALAADDLWKKMRKKVEEGEMPPEKAEQLTAE